MKRYDQVLAKGCAQMLNYLKRTRNTQLQRNGEANAPQRD
jgi:hypothetical protein